MSTTLTEEPRAERVRKDPPPAKANPAVPRHLAIALNASRDCAVSLDAATTALRAILSGCADSGVTVLTLLRPAYPCDSFDAALASARVAVPGFDKVTINLATPRMGRAELLEAVKTLAAQARGGKLAPADIDAEKIENVLSTRGLPPVDLLIATNGGGTLCGALLWQSAYAELLFIEPPWHSFARSDFDAALADYARRCRKFGGLA